MEAEISKPDFWTDSKRAERLISELKFAKSVNEPYSRLFQQCHELKELIGIVEENDEASLAHLSQDIKTLENGVNAMEFRSLLSGEDHRSNAI